MAALVLSRLLLVVLGAFPSPFRTALPACLGVLLGRFHLTDRIALTTRLPIPLAICGPYVRAPHLPIRIAVLSRAAWASVSVVPAAGTMLMV